jgi:pyrroloquinoline quinone biosynthesis protein E
MQEPCSSCPEKDLDLGGCRCQAYMLTGDRYATDPICEKSPDRHLISDAVKEAEQSGSLIDEPVPLLFRNTRNAKNLSMNES